MKYKAKQCRHCDRIFYGIEIIPWRANGYCSSLCEEKGEAVRQEMPPVSCLEETEE